MGVFMRVSDIQLLCRQRKLDGIIVMNTGERKKDPIITAIAGVDVESGILIIPVRKNPLLVVSSLNAPIIKSSSRISVISSDGNYDIDVKRALGNAHRIGVNGLFCSLHEIKLLHRWFNRVKIIDVSESLVKLRSKKEFWELKRLKTAAIITDEIFTAVIKRLPFAHSELEIARWLLEEAVKRNVKSSFEPIVASGKNASLPHHVPSSKLYAGFCVIDYGIIYQGYCSDMTRTVFFGLPTKAEKELYKRVLFAEEQTIANVHSTITLKSLDNKARQFLGRYSKFFIHSIGHSLGVEIHDPLLRKYKRGFPLPENAVVTIEPGIYLKNKFGIRIEDEVIVKKNRAMTLTKFSKELIVIKDCYKK